MGKSSGFMTSHKNKERNLQMSDNMQRKHFEMIAGILAKLNPISDTAKDYKTALVHHFADELAKTNQKFDADKFITACNTGNMGKGRSHKNVRV
jgi:hypothetical protein